MPVAPSTRSGGATASVPPPTTSGKPSTGGGGGLRHQATQGAGAREQQAEASLCRHGAGECGAEGCPRKKALRPVERREVVTHMVTQGGLPVQRACQAARLSRATYYRPVV